MWFFISRELLFVLSIGCFTPVLILTICRNAPWMTLSSFCVLISRVESLKGLRILQFDRDGLDAVRRQMSDLYLHAWEHAYTDTGDWSDDRAIAALNNIRDLRNRQRDKEPESSRHEASFATNDTWTLQTTCKEGLYVLYMQKSGPQARQMYICD